MMRGMQRNHPVWHAVLYNCNRFVGDIAQNMGLQSPGNSLLMPKEYINTLKSMNGGRAQLSGPAPPGSRPRRRPSVSRPRSGSPAAANARQEAAVNARHD